MHNLPCYNEYFDWLLDDFPHVTVSSEFWSFKLKAFLKFMSWLSTRYTYSLQNQMNKSNDFYEQYNWIFGNFNLIFNL